MCKPCRQVPGGACLNFENELFGRPRVWPARTLAYGHTSGDLGSTRREAAMWSHVGEACDHPATGIDLSEALSTGESHR